MVAGANSGQLHGHPIAAVRAAKSKIGTWSHGHCASCCATMEVELMALGRSSIWQRGRGWHIAARKGPPTKACKLAAPESYAGRAATLACLNCLKRSLMLSSAMAITSAWDARGDV